MGKSLKKISLPEVVYVVRETDRDNDEWLSATKTVDGIDDGAQVGVYILQDVKTMRVSHDLTDL